MKCRISLFLKGAYFISEEVVFTANAGVEMSIEDASMREEELRSAAQKMRIRYLRQIIKCEYDYDVVATFQSKLNFNQYDEDERSE